MIFSEIDTQRFGFKVAKTNGEVFRDATKEYIEKTKLDYKLIIARVSLNDITLINSLEDIGFRIKDTQITYKHDLKNLHQRNKIDTPIFIREFQNSDTKYLMKMAKECFIDYGHYFNNKSLNRDRCLEIYEDWTYNTCTNKNLADKIIIACEEDEPVGFLSFKIYDHGIHKRFAAGGIGAVNLKERGKNIFPKILNAGLDWAYENNLDWCEHNVLVNNFAVNRSMNKSNFKAGNPQVTMHLTLI